MKLELKHLAAYLPYELMIINSINKKCQLTLIDASYHLEKGFKPILRHLSDLTKEIEVDGEKLTPCNEIMGDMGKNYLINLSTIDSSMFNIFAFMEYEVYEFLVSLHFDIFGLIDKGLAVDINTLRP